MLVQQRQHSPHQHHEKPVERPPHVATVVAAAVDIGVGKTAAMSVSVSVGVGVEVCAEIDEQVDENVGVLLVEEAVGSREHVVQVAVRKIDQVQEVIYTHSPALTVSLHCVSVA